MNLKEENKERWNDPAGPQDKTKVNGLEVVYLHTKNKEEKEEEKTETGAKVERRVMGPVISDQLEEGLVFYTEEYKEEKSKGSEIGE